ncbi:hypothetical protein L0128_19890 [candidate division KSB1 bacterium]|nr:hypothetical protein [candidate division KSB1 bacterium]
MRTPFSRLQEKVSLFGNHHHKYLHFIQTKAALIIERLEAQGLLEQMHLWQSGGAHLVEEMAMMRRLGGDQKEQLDFLGWYYSVQFLLMNTHAIDVLPLNLTTSPDPSTEYRRFMKEIGLSFRHLTAEYMRNLLEIFLTNSERPRYAILGVGTRADQDDIDIGIVDDGSPPRRSLNHAVGQLQSEMLKHASRLDFYLSEHVGSQLYSASIDEYNALLSDQIHNFIIISEMLGAALILGDQPLFSQFQRQITDRYYFKKDADNRYHEAYLRGILGEIRTLLAQGLFSVRLHPKNDALRIIKGLAYAGKTIYRVRQVNAWDILEDLARRQPRLRGKLQVLEQSLSFFEIFRFLYQLYVVQEEEIFLEDSTSDTLELIAVTMGYRRVGTKSARDFLWVKYYEKLKETRQVAASLLADFTQHLKTFSVFNAVLQTQHAHTAPDQNFIRDFFRTAKFFKGTKFWDDLFQIMAENDSQILKLLVAHWQLLTSNEQIVYSRTLAHVGKVSFYSLMTVLVLIAKHRNQPGFPELFAQLNAAFLRAMAEERSRTWRITRLYSYAPGLIHDYILAINEESQKEFIHLLETGEIYHEEDVLISAKLKRLGELYFNSSRYFRRYFLEVINRSPQYIEYIGEPEKLKKISKGLLGLIESSPNYQEKKAKLHESFYIDFFRVGLETLMGATLEHIEEEFTEFYYNYLQTLFNICKEEVNAELRIPLVTHDVFAIFVAGSVGREQAFDDDLDVIVLLDSDDQALRQHCSKIITRMNREISRLAILPHYRLAEYFGEYVTTMSDLELFLSQKSETHFIEKSQLLGAQMVVGSSRFEKVYFQRIIQPYIFQDRQNFVTAMIQEMESRHAALPNIPEADYNLKETVGGLRDIESVLLICKTCFQLMAPVNRKFIDLVADQHAPMAPYLTRLRESFDFLKQLRNLYRILVAAKNTIALDYVAGSAQIMGFKSTPEKSAAEQLLQRYFEICQQSSAALNQLIVDYYQKLIQVN